MTVDRAFLLDAKVDVLEDYMLDALVARLSAFVLCGPIKKVKTKYPKTTWDHFKLEYCPKWFINRYPINFVEVTFDVREHFPESTNKHFSIAGSKSGSRHLDVAYFEGFKI